MSHQIPLLLATLGAAASGATPCSAPGMAVFADMHDGDQKAASLQESTITIKPFNNTQKWIVEARWDAVHCNASVDFNVPGKPNPPPVPLTLTYYLGTGGEGQPALRTVVFTDPTGKLAPAGMPLNAWIEIDHSRRGQRPE